MWNLSSDSSFVPLILVRERESFPWGKSEAQERKFFILSTLSESAPFRAGEDRERAKQNDIHFMAVVEDDDDVEVRFLTHSR